MIVCITGGFGTGKTCLLTRYGVKSYKEIGKKIISNYHLKNIPYEKLDIVDLYLNKPDLKNITILGDELYTFMDCRLSTSKRNLLTSYFILQTRKKNVDLYFTAQDDRFIDKRLMRFIDIYIKCDNIWLDDMLPDGSFFKKKHPYLFLITLHDYRDINNIQVKQFVFNGKPYFNEYDTNEVIYPPDDYLNIEQYFKEKKKEKRKKNQTNL